MEAIHSILMMLKNAIDSLGPYWPTIGVFVLTNYFLKFFEDWIGLRGIVRVIVAIIITALYYYYWDPVVAKKFGEWLRFMGLQPVDGQNF